MKDLVQCRKLEAKFRQLAVSDPPPTPKVTIGRRFTVSPERLTGIVLYLGLERKNRDDAGHPQCRSTTKHHMGGMS